MARLHCSCLLLYLMMACRLYSQAHVMHGNVLHWSSVQDTESVIASEHLDSIPETNDDSLHEISRAIIRKSLHVVSPDVHNEMDEYLKDLLNEEFDVQEKLSSSIRDKDNLSSDNEKLPELDDISADSSDILRDDGNVISQNDVESDYSDLLFELDDIPNGSSDIVNDDNISSLDSNGSNDNDALDNDDKMSSLDDMKPDDNYHEVDNYIFIDRSASFPVEYIAVSVETDKSVHTVEEEYISFNINFEILYPNQDPWKYFNLSSPRLVTILKGLAPAIWRIGGYDCQNVLFDVTKAHLDAAKLDKIYMMPKDLLVKFIKATEASGTRFLYDLNSMTRIGASWDPTNTIHMFEFLQANGYGKNLDFELGNEPTGYPMSPERIGYDLSMLHRVIRSFPNLAGSRIVGPDSVGIEPGTKGWNTVKAVASQCGDFITAITFHQYYFKGTDVDYKAYIDPGFFPMLVRDIGWIHQAVNSSKYPNTPIWIGETADGWARGTPKVSDRYVSGFLWLDKLGLSARLGVSLIMRQTLRNGDYEMVGDNLIPNPDYWLSYLHKHLVGTKVLSVALNGTAFSTDQDPAAKQYTRVYAHCTKLSNAGIAPSYPRGSVTIFGLNVSPNISKSLVLPPDWSKAPTDLYLLTPPKGDLLSQQVLLNDQILQLISDTQLPQLSPKTLSPQKPFILPPLTFGFLVVPHANANACL